MPRSRVPFVTQRAPAVVLWGAHSQFAGGAAVDEEICGGKFWPEEGTVCDEVMGRECLSQQRWEPGTAARGEKQGPSEEGK